MWMQRVVAPVEGDRGVAAHEVGLLFVTGNCRGIEDLIGCRIPAVSTGSDARRQVGKAAADFKQPSGLPLNLGARLGALQQVVGPVFLQAVLAEPEEVFLRKLVVLGVD